ncbi:uncharacterized protein LOC120085080 isoform X1 [Benincasa hispida]|uniref:uncharacterized protein LOC120085080 isoform X1 n=1 Tax=Benincasa hispida TaxID=102211 RepID=UPI0019007302|nr:uncharacterized protein LOC120085080 isoform X1 [Benincasa hispida]
MFMAFHQKWLQNPISLFKKLFHLLTLTLLTLSLPLSFLLFCRLVRSHYLHALLPLSTPLPSILSVDRVLLLSLISLISVAAFLDNLLGKSILPTKSSGLTAAWLVLCALQVAMALGIDQGMEIVIDVSSLGLRRSLWCRLMFFLGLHTTMIHWSKVAVKSVVDDTVFGAPMEESWSERIAMAVSFGGLWLWRLRDEAESPAIVAENMMELLMDPTMVDFCSLALYYLIVAIGFVKTLRSFVWFLKFLLRERKEESSSQFSQAKRIEVV